MRMARARAQRLACPLMLPPLDDLNAVKAALTQVTYALDFGHLEQRRAGLLLYALQQAATNLWRIELIQMNSARSTKQSQTAPEDEPQRRLEQYPGFEAEFGLPPGLDLTKPPEVLFPPTEPGLPGHRHGQGDDRAESRAVIHPHQAWTAELSRRRNWTKQRPYMREKTMPSRSSNIQDRIHKKVKTEIRKEQGGGVAGRSRSPQHAGRREGADLAQHG